MPGLDKTTLDALEYKTAIKRINSDIKSDFIIAPHYSSVFANVGEELWESTRSQLQAGVYEPDLPINMEVPKRSGLTRPGSILTPKDRLIYQLLIDLIAPFGQAQLNRSRVYSNVLLDPDPDGLMFQPSSVYWNKMQHNIESLCSEPHLTHVLKTDIASFFERVNHHHLVNLLHSSNCPPNAVNLLEKLLPSWTEKTSHGILQGMFPSDFLGNFYLLSFDSEVEVLGHPSVRYVDDIYIFFGSRLEAQSFLVHITHFLRKEGLILNEYKTNVVRSEELLREETELDRLFGAAKTEIESGLINRYVDWYNLQAIWTMEDVDIEEEDINLLAVEHLYSQVVGVNNITSEKIEKFCLPFLAISKSQNAVERSIKGIMERPHLVSLYSNYLGVFVSKNSDVVNEIERFIPLEELLYDSQVMWTIALLVRAKKIRESTLNAAFRMLIDKKRTIGLRAICAILVAKHGNVGLRRNLRHHYQDEPSEYVKSAILFSSMFFPSTERKTCLRTWGGHSQTNALIVQAVKKLVN